MGKGGGSSTKCCPIQYAEYITDKHDELLTWEADKIKELVDQSPFVDYEDLEVGLGFFGAGYVLSSFPSLYDMYGKFIAGLDVEFVFGQIFKDTTDGPIIHNLMSDQAAQLSYDLESEIIPRYEVGMRDINAVVSGTFVIGRALLENKRTQELSRFGSELRYKMMPISIERWRTHLEWNKEVVLTYARMLQLYMKSYIDIDGYNYDMHAKDTLWPFTLYEYQRSALSGIGGGGGTGGIAGSRGSSTAGRMLGGAMTGAAAGSAFGPAGTAIGGVLGLAMGLF